MGRTFKTFIKKRKTLKQRGGNNNILFFSGFDGTLTGKSSNDTITSKFYKNLYEPMIQKTDYRDIVMSYDTLLKKYRESITSNSEFKITDEAVSLIIELLNRKITLIIISNNTIYIYTK